MKKLSRENFKKLAYEFIQWYVKYLSAPPFLNLGADCLKEFLVVNNNILKYNDFKELEDLMPAEKKAILLMQAFCLHYYQYKLFTDRNLFSDIVRGLFVLDRERVGSDIINKCLGDFERGIKKIEAASKIKDNSSSFLNEFFDGFYPRTYRLLYSDKARFLNDFMDNSEEAINIFNYLLGCEADGMLEFSFETRISLISILLSAEEPDIDFIWKLYIEMLDNKNYKLFNEVRILSALSIYKYYYENADYENALRPLLAWNEYCDKYKLEKNLYLKDEIASLEEKIKEKTDLSNEVLNTINVNLSRYFEDSIIKLMKYDVKVLLSTSLQMYDYFFNDEADKSGYLDYSPVNVSGLKAIEEILFEIIGQAYLGYLNNQRSINFSEIPPQLQDGYNRNTLKASIDFLEYGTAIYAMTYKNRATLDSEVVFHVKSLFKQFCLDNSITNEQIDKIPQLAKELDKLRIARNANSHKNRIIYSAAKECKEMLFDTLAIVNKLYAIFGNLFEAE